MSIVTRLLAHIGLQKRILLSVAVGLGVALGGVALLSLYLMNQSTERILNEQLAVAEVTASHVDHVLQSVARQLQTVAAQESSSLDEGSLGDAQLALTRAHALMQYTVGRLMLLDQNGRIVLVAPPDASLVGLDYTVYPHVQRTLDTGLPAFATVHGATAGGRPGIAVTAPVRDRSGRLAGLVSGEIDFSRQDAGDLLQPVKVGQTGFLQLVDENGLVLATTAPTSPRSVDVAASGVATTHPEHFPSLIREGQPVVRVCHTCHQTNSGLQRSRDIMAFAPLPGAPFGVALRLTEDDVFATSHALQRTLLVYSIGVLVLGLFFAWLTTNAVVRPLEALTAAARRIGAGDLDSPVQLAGARGVGETTTLAATLEAMRRRLHASYERIERLNRYLEERVALRTRELSILFEVSQTLTRTVDVDALMQMVVEKIVSVLDAADAALLYIYDPAEAVLIPRAAVGYDLSKLGDVRLQRGEATAGKVLEAGLPLLFANRESVSVASATLGQDNARSFGSSRLDAAEPEAALGAPIIYEGNVTGVLMLENLHDQGTFDPADLAMVQALADQVAIAIEHARLVREAGQVQALREANRLKAEFLYSVSHELRTPLSSIVSLIEVLIADYRTIPRRQLGQVLGIIQRSSGRLKDMVENLLDAGSIQAGRFRVQPEPASLALIVHDAIACVRPLLDARGQSVAVDLPEPDLTLVADRERIVQVLVNLLSNANKYCPAGERLHLSAVARDSWLHVRLADSGPGIAPDDQAHLFEPFYRSLRPLSVSGAGLGLAIVKAIVEAHGGHVTLDSAIGVGTVFSFTLPLAVERGADSDLVAERV